MAIVIRAKQAEADSYYFTSQSSTFAGTLDPRRYQVGTGVVGTGSSTVSFASEFSAAPRVFLTGTSTVVTGQVLSTSTAAFVATANVASSTFYYFAVSLA